MDPRLTAFEPEARGNLVEGLEFHKFYFDNGEFLMTDVSVVSLLNYKLCTLVIWKVDSTP